MNLFGLLQISGSALLAQRERAEMSASNLANAETTRTIEGGPYKRQNVIFAASHPFSRAKRPSLSEMDSWDDVDGVGPVSFTVMAARLLLTPWDDATLTLPDRLPVVA